MNKDVAHILSDAHIVSVHYRLMGDDLSKVGYRQNDVAILRRDDTLGVFPHYDRVKPLVARYKALWIAHFQDSTSFR